jgi:hypothetical protein
VGPVPHIRSNFSGETPLSSRPFLVSTAQSTHFHPQFLTGMAVVANSFYLGNCSGNKITAVFSTAVNVSFIALFSAFYVRKYFMSADKNMSPKSKTSSGKRD